MGLTISDGLLAIMLRHVRAHSATSCSLAIYLAVTCASDCLCGAGVRGAAPRLRGAIAKAADVGHRSPPRVRRAAAPLASLLRTLPLPRRSARQGRARAGGGGARRVGCRTQDDRHAPCEARGTARALLLSAGERANKQWDAVAAATACRPWPAEVRRGARPRNAVFDRLAVISQASQTATSCVDQVFEANEIDLEAIALCADADFAEMEIPKGPRVKIAHALRQLEAKQAASTPTKSRPAAAVALSLSLSLALSLSFFLCLSDLFSGHSHTCCRSSRVCFPVVVCLRCGGPHPSSSSSSSSRSSSSSSSSSRSSRTSRRRRRRRRSRSRPRRDGIDYRRPSRCR